MISSFSLPPPRPPLLSLTGKSFEEREAGAPREHQHGNAYSALPSHLVRPLPAFRLIPAVCNPLSPLPRIFLTSRAKVGAPDVVTSPPPLVKRRGPLLRHTHTHTLYYWSQRRECHVGPLHTAGLAHRVLLTLPGSIPHVLGAGSLQRKHSVSFPGLRTRCRRAGD